MWPIPCLVQTEAWAKDSLWELRGSYSAHSNPWQTNPGKGRAHKPSRRKMIRPNSWPTNTLIQMKQSRKENYHVPSSEEEMIKKQHQMSNNFRIMFLIIIFHSPCKSKNWIWIYLIYYSIALPLSCFIFFFHLKLVLLAVLEN